MWTVNNARRRYRRWLKAWLQPWPRLTGHNGIILSGLTTFGLTSLAITTGITTRMLRFSFLLLAGTAFAQQYTISTVAGGAPPATPASALSTTIGSPRRLALAGGNLYFSSGNSVFK